MTVDILRSIRRKSNRNVSVRSEWKSHCSKYYIVTSLIPDFIVRYIIPKVY